MSSYVNFYIKDIKRDDKFVYLDGFSADSYIYDAFNEIVGDNIDENSRCKILKFDDLEAIEGSLKEHKQQILKHIEELNKEKEDILNANNSLAEKRVALEDFYEWLKDENLEVEELEFSLDFYNVLWGISNYGGNRVYAGIEGINPDGSEDNDNNEEGDK